MEGNMLPLTSFTLALDFNTASRANFKEGLRCKAISRAVSMSRLSSSANRLAIVIKNTTPTFNLNSIKYSFIY